MTEAEIMEAFITAAETEMKMPKSGERPRSYGAYPLQTVHSFEDKLNWRKEIGDQLIRGDNPLDEERQAFTDGRSSKVIASDVTHWETCLRWTMKLLDDPRERRALWAWSFAKAGGMPLAKWCRRIERIHPETATRRKNRAVARISANLVRGNVLNIESGGSAVLPCGPVFGESDGILAEDASSEKRSFSWMADDAFSRVLGSEYDDFSWAEARNKRRREHDARRRQKQVA